MTGKSKLNEGYREQAWCWNCRSRCLIEDHPTSWLSNAVPEHCPLSVSEWVYHVYQFGWNRVMNVPLSTTMGRF